MRNFNPLVKIIIGLMPIIVGFGVGIRDFRTNKLHSDWSAGSYSPWIKIGLGLIIGIIAFIYLFS